jgi:hypothetical protein
MSRSERTAYFERLVALRDGYGAATDDRRAVLSIADAVRYAEAIMTAVELDAEPWVAEPDDAVPDRSDERGHPHGPRFASDLWPWPTRRLRTARRDDVAGD